MRGAVCPPSRRQHAGKGTLAEVAGRMPPQVDGRALVRMTEAMLANICGSRQLGEMVYDAVRAEIKRVDKFMADRRTEARETAARSKSGKY